MYRRLWLAYTYESGLQYDFGEGPSPRETSVKLSDPGPLQNPTLKNKENSHKELRGYY